MNDMLNQELSEARKSLGAARHGQAQARVMAQSLRARGDLRNAAVASQIADKLMGICEQFIGIIGDIEYRQRQLDQLYRERYESMWADEIDYRESEASDHV